MFLVTCTIVDFKICFIVGTCSSLLWKLILDSRQTLNQIYRSLATSGVGQRFDAGWWYVSVIISGILNVALLWSVMACAYLACVSSILAICVKILCMHVYGSPWTYYGDKFSWCKFFYTKAKDVPWGSLYLILSESDPIWFPLFVSNFKHFFNIYWCSA